MSSSSLEVIRKLESKVEKDRNGKITSNDLALREGFNTAWFKEQLNISLGSYVKSLPPEKMSSLALGMVSSSPYLSVANPITIFGSILQVANLGLSLDGFRGEAYLVPFWNNKKSCYEAKPMIGYRGLHKKLIDSGFVKKVDTNVYRHGDVFTIRFGDGETIYHEPKGVKESVEGAYAIIWLTNGSRQFDRMFIEELDEIRDRSKSAFDKDGNLTGPWKTDTNEMRRKTVLRRLAKWASVSADATKAATIEEYGENVNTTFRVVDGGAIDYSVEEEKPIEVQQPKRMEAINVPGNGELVVTNGKISTEELKGIFDDNDKKTEEPTTKKKTITEGQVKRMFAILNRAKKRTEEQLKEEILKPLGIEHSNEIPMDIYDSVIGWLEGKEFANQLGE